MASIEVTFDLEEEWIDRLTTALATLEMWGTEDVRSPAECLELAIKGFVRGLEREIEDERRRMEEYDDSDVPF